MILILSQQLNNTSPQASNIYNIAVENLDAWLSDGLLHMELGDNQFNIIATVVSALKFREIDWTLLAWRTSSGKDNTSHIFQEAIEKRNTSIDLPFFREIEGLILDPRRAGFTVAQKLNSTLDLLNVFNGCTLRETQL